MTHEEQQTPEALTVVACGQGRLVVRWVELGWTVAVELSAADGGTVLVLTQDLDPGSDAADVAGGWHWYLDKLDSEVSGSPQPAPWEAFWAEVGPHYATT